jgi:hypothetical protein
VLRSFLSRSFLNRALRRFPQKPELRIALSEERLCFSDGKEVSLDKSAEAANWRPALDALAQIIPSHRGESASLILADQFVRYALLPWSDTLKTHEQWLALARHRFCAIHGPLANEWEIKFAETAPAGPRLACAVDRELIEELGTLFVARGVPLASVQPYLVAAFNRVRHMTGGSCWMVIEEPGRLTLALFLRGVWVAIRSRRADEHWRRTLPELIERESAFLGLDEACTRVIVCAQGRFDAAGDEDFRLGAEHQDFRLDALSYQDLAVSAA